jgi:glycosyltransferase involved in cell wall biosynthesis
MKLCFLIPGDIHSLTGGYLYNLRITEGLQQRGHAVQILKLHGPLSNVAATEETCRLHLGKMEEGTWVIIDSLAMGALRKIIQEFRHRLRLAGLIHLPVSYDPLTMDQTTLPDNDELGAMQDSCHLILTGKFLRQLLLDSGVAMEKISVVEPGVDLFPRKPAYAKFPSELLCLSNYTPLKAQHVLIDALGKISHREWTLRLYGNLNSNRDYVKTLMAIIKRKNLEKRILLHDTLERRNLSAPFLKADLFVLPSLFESYGMVLTESLAHGIPVVSTTAGNIPDTVPASMGMLTIPGDANDLASVLDEIISREGTYTSLCEAAAQYFLQARSWNTTLDEFESILCKDIPRIYTP